MRNFNRVIAIITMMVFTPASVLAGTPLRLCIGDDGHRAIEFVLADAHHAAANDDHDCTDADEHHVAPSSDCLDVPLLSTAQAVSPLAPGILSALKGMLSLSLVVKAAIPLAANARVMCAQAIGAVRPQPRMLRTVKLLI